MSKRTLDAFLGKPATAVADSGPSSWSWNDGPGWSSGFRPASQPQNRHPGAPVTVASYDMDGTLIAVKSGKRFPRDKLDWKLLSPAVPKKLSQLPPATMLVIFSNQAGVAACKITLPDIKDKVQAVVKALDASHCHVRVYLATTKGGKYRKPATGMWSLLKTDLAGSDIDMDQSFFVGDAAGRPASQRHIKDHSSSDWKFALNVGLSFCTPEQHFMGIQAEAVVGSSPSGFNPSHFLETNESQTSPTLDDLVHPPGKAALLQNIQQVVLLVGWPGSGKTSFAKKFLEPAGYVWINQDTLKSKARCIAAMESALQEGKSVVIDNTNGRIASRASYIAVAKRANLKCRCLVLQTPRALAEHLNVFRENQTHGRAPRIPAVGYHTYNKNFEDPKQTEGLDDVLQVKIALHFEQPRDRELFLQWT